MRVGAFLALLTIAAAVAAPRASAQSFNIDFNVGIAGQSHFVVKSGLAKGDQVVSGPFKAIADLKDGERVKIKQEKKPGA